MNLTSVEVPNYIDPIYVVTGPTLRKRERGGRGCCYYHTDNSIKLYHLFIHTEKKRDPTCSKTKRYL